MYGGLTCGSVTAGDHSLANKGRTTFIKGSAKINKW